MKFGVGKKRSISVKLMILFLVLTIFSTNQLASSDSWPMFLKEPQHTGNTTSTAPNTNYTLWTTPTIGGNGWSSPAVANGRVFVVNNGGGGILYSLYANNGTEIWSKTIGNGAIYTCSTPAIADGKVYAVGNRLYCFYENNGTEVWNKSVSGNGVGTSSPTVADGRVFIYTQTLYCFYANNGTEIWNKSVDGNGYSTPAVANGKVVVNGGNLYCLYANNGTEIWNITGGGIGNSPAIANGKVFYNPSAIYCLYENNGTEIWSQSNGGDSYSSPAVANSKVFVNDNGNIYCYYENNGTEIWQITIAGSGYSTPAVSSDGKVVVNGGGYTYCLNESNGAEIWSYITGGDGYSSPAIANGRVFVNQGTIYCFGSTSPTIDYIIIRDAPNGGGTNLCNPANYPTYPVGYTTTFYGAAYNNTAPGDGYIFDVPITSTWNSDNTSVVDVSSPGSNSTITCSSINNGTVTITLDDLDGHTNTTQITVLELEIDYIQIRDAAGGGGNVVTTHTYSIQEVDEFYAAAYNNTVSYLYDVVVVWESDNTSVGKVDSPGIWTNFTPLVVSRDSTCTVYATHGSGISNSTGILTVRVVLDFILIRDNPRALGDEVNWISINGGETRTYYVAGYNATTGVFMGIIVVSWSITGEIGTLDIPRGYSTNFTGSNVAGVNVAGTFTVFYEGLPPLTIGVTVYLPPSAPTGVSVFQKAQGESLTLRWTASPEPDVVGYIIYRSETSGSNFSGVANILGAQNTYYLDTGLVDNTTYYYYIVAYDDGPNYSPASGVISGVSDKDTDLDRLFNLVDDDDDGDGLSDTEEAEAGLNPLLADTDGDGHNDKEDYYPLDIDRWEKPGEFQLLPLLILIIVIIVVLILIFALSKRRKKS